MRENIHERTHICTGKAVVSSLLVNKFRTASFDSVGAAAALEKKWGTTTNARAILTVL